MTDFRSILQEADENPKGAGRLAEVLYKELRLIASRELARERPDHTLQPTALVHEAWIRLIGSGPLQFESKGHFFGAAARSIRRILVEHARSRARLKRGGGEAPLEYDEDRIPIDQDSHDELLALDSALEKLSEVAPEKAKLVELRFFAGLTLDEVAQTLGVSPSKVVRDWRTARAWLQSRIDHYGLADPGSDES